MNLELKNDPQQASPVVRAQALYYGARVVVATHYLTYGPSQALREYLLQEKNRALLFLAHPLAGSNQEDRSYFELIENGLIKTKKTAGPRSQSFFVNCCSELFLNIKWSIASRQRYDLFVGVDNWNCLAGLFLKNLGLVKKVVYYVIDYFPTRFDNKLLNWFYFQVDKFCVRWADETWNLSVNMANARERDHQMSQLKYNRQKVVPIGVWFDKITRQDFSQVKKRQAVFVGHLLEMMGVQLVIRAIPLILKKISDFHFLIIGGGEYETTLKNLTKKMGVENSVTFTGWIKDRQERDRLMADSAVGIAV
ncbi:MAG: glycosyltransferase, partial [Patescibacteria group bacterium]